MKLLIIGALSLGLVGTAHATSLKELLAIADAQNIDRRITVEQRNKAVAEFNQAWTGLLPSLTAQGVWTDSQYPAEIAIRPGAPKLVITPKDQLDGTLRFELPLIDTTRWLRADAMGAAEDSAMYRDLMVRDAVRRQVSATYYSLAAALALQQSAKRSLQVAEAQENLQQIRNEAGAATELEVLRAKAESQRNKQTVADTEALVANTRRTLRSLTGVEVDDAVLPDDNVEPAGDLATFEGGLENLPGVKAADKDAQVAEKLATAAKLGLVPVVTANFTERFTNATGFTGKYEYYTAGIGLLWRLDGPTFFNMSAQASGAEIARLNAERQRLTLRDQVNTDWQRLRAAGVKVAAAAAQVTSARRASQLASDRYSAGAATQLDVIQAQRDLFLAEVSDVQARTELASSHVALRLSAGLELDLK